MNRKWIALSLFVLGALLLTLGLAQPAQARDTQAAALSAMEQLGKQLFFDANLSKNSNQSCATCHDPAVGYTGPDANINAHGAVYPGSDPTLFGNRKPPAASYAGDSQPMVYSSALGGWVGGMFWDGRADGSVLGDPLAEQAMGPFLNPLEMALPNAEALCDKVAASSYAGLFVQVWGALDCANAGAVYEQIGIAIAAYERSSEVNPYTSKFDKFWDAAKKKRLDVTQINLGNWTRYRKLGFSDTELYGLAMFNDPTSANCAACHSLQPGSKGYPMFTDYSYDNLGVPRNLENPFYQNLDFNPAGSNWVDIGLGGFLLDAAQDGKQKVPTLRNVDKRPYATFVKAYTHNGALKSLSDVVRFYASRAMSGMGGMGGGYMWGGGGGGGGGGMCGGTMFGPPEVDANLATLNMFRCMDRTYLETFLKTLSDGYFVR